MSKELPAPLEALEPLAATIQQIEDALSAQDATFSKEEKKEITQEKQSLILDKFPTKKEIEKIILYLETEIENNGQQCLDLETDSNN